MGNFESCKSTKVHECFEGKYKIGSLSNFQCCDPEMQNTDELVLLMAKDSKGDWREINAVITKFLCISPKFEKILEDSCLDFGFKCWKRPVIKFYDINYKILDIILKYFWNGEVEFDGCIIGDLRKAASAYLIEDLLVDIDDIMFDDLTTQNFCETYKCYSKLNDFSLLQSCVNRLSSLEGNLNDVIKSQYFLKLRLYPDLQLLIQALLCLDVDVQYLQQRCLDWSSEQPVNQRHHAYKQITMLIELGLSSGVGLHYQMFPIIEDIDSCSNRVKIPPFS